MISKSNFLTKKPYRNTISWIDSKRRSRNHSISNRIISSILTRNLSWNRKKQLTKLLPIVTNRKIHQMKWFIDKTISLLSIPLSMLIQSLFRPIVRRKTMLFIIHLFQNTFINGRWVIYFPLTRFRTMQIAGLDRKASSVITNHVQSVRCQNSKIWKITKNS